METPPKLPFAVWSGPFPRFFLLEKEREGHKEGGSKLKVGLSLGYPPSRQTKVESRE